MREFLRKLPVFTGVLAGFDTDDVPPTPQTLFERWLREAVDAGVREPHAMTPSTVDEHRRPDARVLILKDLDAAGWWFASGSSSAKGVQLNAEPQASLTFYWPDVARQVRVRGDVTTASVQANAADFLARGTTARAVALAGAGREILADRDTCRRAVERSGQAVSLDPALVEPSWTLFVVRPRTVEFWQADTDRMHHRLSYRVTDDGWDRTLLWP